MSISKRFLLWDFSDGVAFENLLYNAGDMGLIPGQGTKLPDAARPCTAMKTHHSQNNT